MPRQLLRGAVASPRHKLAAAAPHLITVPAPPQFANLAKKLSPWGNFNYGDCVSAEEASAKATTVFIDEATVIAWAQRHGVLNGAMITDVLDWMQSDGLVGSDGTVYNDGPYNSVDWTDWPTLTSAISQGQVKIGVAAAQLQTAVNSTNDTSGWWMTGASKDTNLDHCVGLAGYGPASYCAAQLGVPVKPGVDPSFNCLLVFTWDTYGIADHNSVVATTGEAWLRNPTTVVKGGPTPTPTPTPTSGVIAAVNAAFAAIERQYARYPGIVRELQVVQQLVMQWLSTHGYSITTVPQTVVAVVDAALDGVAAQYPQYAAVVMIAKMLLDKVLPTV